MAQSTGAYAKAFRKLAKRRNAVRSGEPFLIAMVAWAEEFIYTNGMLCYSVRVDTVRILDVHRSATTELILEASSCLPATILGFSWSQPYKFTPIHYCDGILSCLLVQQTTHFSVQWLAVLNLENIQLVGLQEIEDSQSLFVRNNRDYLFFGTKSRFTNDGERRWEIVRFDIRKQRITTPALALWDFDGEDIGSDICFEIFGDHFYCISNKPGVYRSFPRNSYYHAFRFPLSHPDKSHFEYPPILNLWRRWVLEGAIDPRWNSLQLEKDQASGKLVVYECRKECLRDNAQSQRTCYRRELRFEPAKDTKTVVLDSSSTIDDSSGSGSSGSHTRIDAQDESVIDLGTYIEQRLPENVHVGDNGAFGTNFALSECFVRSYIPSCETFVDIVSTPPFPKPETQQLRLRTRPKTSLEDGLSNSPTVSSVQSIANDKAVVSETRPSGMHLDVGSWPREHSTAAPNPSCNVVRDILAVLSLVTELEWAMDDRSLVYASAVKGQFRPIILVSFDSGIHLPGFSNPTSHDLDFSRQETRSVTKHPPINHRCIHDGLQLKNVNARDGSNPIPASQSADHTTANVSSTSSGSRPQTTPTLGPSNKPWANRVEAFYMKVPTLFADYTHGADLAR